MENIGTYAYAVGRVKALESRLLDNSSMQRMIEALDFDEAQRYLADSDYSGKLLKGSYESILDSFVKTVNETVASFSPDPFFTGMFFAEYDFLRLKAYMKSAFMKSAGLETGAFVVPELGFLAAKDIEGIALDAVFGQNAKEPVESTYLKAGEKKLKDADQLSFCLKKAAYIASAAYRSAGDDPLEIDSAVDKAYYAYLSSTASSRSAQWALKIVEAKADLANLLLIMRASAAGKDAQFIKGSLVRGGRIPTGDLAEAAKEGEGKLRRVLEASPYWKAMGGSFEMWIKDEVMRPFEMAADIYIFGLAKEAKAMTEGYAPVMGYLLMRQQEASMLRRILTGKAKSLAPSYIRERLSDGNA